MSQVEEGRVLSYFETVERWHNLKEAVARLQAEERELREALFKGSFPNAKEGANRLPFPDGRVLVGTYVINRKLDEERWKAEWSRIVREAGLQYPGRLIRSKFEIAVGEYKKLPEQQRLAVDQVLDIKPGLPQLELVPPKQKE